MIVGIKDTNAGRAKRKTPTLSRGFNTYAEGSGSIPPEGLTRGLVFGIAVTLGADP